MTGTTQPQRSFTGRAWVFGDNINTDAMYPGFAMKLEIPEAAQHVFYDLRPDWTSEVSDGDIVIAGRNFGLGSSRPVAVLMRELGVAALVAEEFNSLFLRNAINNGLPAVTVPDVRRHVREGQTITVDLEDSVLIADEARLEFAPLPDFLLQILDAGGLLPRLVADGFLPAQAAEVTA